MERRTTGARAAGADGRGFVGHDRDRVGAIDEERQRDRFGGVNIGAIFFGWLVAIAVSVLLTALLSAAGAAIGITELSTGEVRSGAETLSLIGGILLIVVVLLGYFAGGYVAGRMSRFDGARQGVGVWLLGLVITLLLAALGAIAGSEYNIFAQLNLPRIPIDEGDLATGGLIALVLVLIGTLLAAIAGAKLGEGYHRKVDRAGFAPERG